MSQAATICVPATQWTAMRAAVKAAKAYLEHLDYEHSLPAYLRVHPEIVGGWIEVDEHYQARKQVLGDELWGRLTEVEGVRKEATG